MSETQVTRPETIIGLPIREETFHAMLEADPNDSIAAIAMLDEQAALHHKTAANIERLRDMFVSIREDEGMSFIFNLLVAGEDEQVKGHQEDAQHQATELYKIIDDVKRHGLPKAIINVLQKGSLFDSLNQPAEEIVELSRPYSFAPDPEVKASEAPAEPVEMLPRHARMIAKYYNHGLQDASPIDRLTNTIHGLRNNADKVSPMAYNIVLAMSEILEFIELGLESELDHEDLLTRDLLSTKIHNPDYYSFICTTVGRAVGQTIGQFEEQSSPHLQLVTSETAETKEAAS